MVKVTLTTTEKVERIMMGWELTEIFALTVFALGVASGFQAYRLTSHFNLVNKNQNKKLLVNGGTDE